MHKLLPCAQCGESVCGADLEDHVRDSCALTMQTCRFCALELRRGSLPAHERYCGARTERCEQCGEWVMHKYRQLHLDSNHGFVRLDDDPAPTELSNKATNVPKPPSNINSSRPDPDRPRTETRHFRPTDSDAPHTKTPNISGTGNTGTSHPVVSTAIPGTSQTPLIPRSRLAPNFSSLSGDTSKSQTNASTAIDPVNVGADARAPEASGPSPPTVAATDGFGRERRNEAGARAREDDRRVNSAAATDEVSKNLRASGGAVKKRPAPQPPARAAPPDPRRDSALHSALQRQRGEEAARRERTAHNLARGLPPALSAAAKLDKLRKLDALHNRDGEERDRSHALQGRGWGAPDVPLGHVLGAATSGSSARPDVAELEAARRRRQLRDLKPMSAEQFEQRFGELQLRRGEDRFSQIKSSLQELRRGLSAVTAPYNVANNEAAHKGEERLPCEFCGELVPPDDLVQHQTGCRPDLAQYRPAPPAPRAGSRPESPAPLIPCEFCTAPLPVYLISEHQVRPLTTIVYSLVYIIKLTSFV
ncbi:uncharacterized protein LOC112050706 isoform X3 [Bicyclus anynana]|uniref:Uncharacterized protein LOC112050706 isoform X3 n=1 Tax=Bicyclus anynana TaxID=110368 RepID=A0ABM3LJF3_BICAN|nr:uncharacterized protein LOC112050706 isoform X3 [Bicyclus anynana]